MNASIFICCNSPIDDIADLRQHINRKQGPHHPTSLFLGYKRCQGCLEVLKGKANRRKHTCKCKITPCACIWDDLRTCTWFQYSQMLGIDYKPVLEPQSRERTVSLFNQEEERKNSFDNLPFDYYEEEEQKPISETINFEYFKQTSPPNNDEANFYDYNLFNKSTLSLESQVEKNNERYSNEKTKQTKEESEKRRKYQSINLLCFHRV